MIKKEEMIKLNGLTFQTDLGHGNIEYIVNVEGDRVTVETESSIGWNKVYECVFNEVYENFSIEKFVNDLHEQRLEELSEYVWEEMKMKKVYENVELDFTNKYPEAGEPVIVIADVEVENGEVVGAIAKETNEIFGVEAGQWFDPEDIINVGDLE